MLSTAYPSKAIRLSLVLLIVVGILFAEFTLQSRLAQANSSQDCNLALTTRTPKSNILCGKLVFLTGYYPNIYGKPSVSTIGLIPCGSGKPLIFKIHPLDLVPFYQFRDPQIGSGEMICTDQYGCLSRYLLTFKNYIGLESCAMCGISMAPPTWTQVPLTPYTLTPIPPTRTPWPTPVSPTPSPTLSQGETTPTLVLFEVLHGTATPTSGAIVPAQPTVTETPAIQANVPVPGITPTAVEPFYRRIEPVEWIMIALLALIIPLAIVFRKVWDR